MNIIAATRIRERPYSERRSLSNWLAFWGIHRLLPCFEVFAQKDKKEGNTFKCMTLLKVMMDRILAGAVSGLPILALDDSSRRRTLALYLLARLAQCAYNSAKSKNKFHLWGSHWNHGDTLLFAIACAQVMYSFVMLPESLPKSYQDFIQKTGPVAAPVYKAVRECCRGSPVDAASLAAYLSGRTSSDVKLDKFPELIPCSVIHPDTKSCLVQNANAAKATFRKNISLVFLFDICPVCCSAPAKGTSISYLMILLMHPSSLHCFNKLSITEVSCRSFRLVNVYFIVIFIPQFMDAPVRTCRTAVTNAVRSTSFLSAFVGIFQGVICLHRKVALKDHKLVKWLAGGLSAMSILLEKKARHGELALYVLPRAGESLWYILVNRRLLPDIKNAEVALFCACMGGIMYYLEQEPDTMAPFLRGLIRRFLASRISNPGPPAGRSASYSYLQTLDAMKKPDALENQENGTTSSEKYNLESIPGP
ncbi:hypothetical protein SASPL_123414 [Salvia splendens]|uniref:Transmembrane protein 135 N-terminal domain-containing protein n=1 Tax=Salvia splendens TaxID=180675 RepID=A0A8X8ZT62_SALSN|nr:hypothetical protein SASPL_123414 [Salvia splendens]